MSYPDDWNHIQAEDKMHEARMMVEHEIEALDVMTRQAAERGDYTASAHLRTKRDNLKEKAREVAQSHAKFHRAASQSPFKKALVVPDNFVASKSIMPSVYQADIILTESGRMLKSRCTKFPQTPQVPPPYTEMAAVLELLSGDLNHDNVAKAKEILKKALA